MLDFCLFLRVLLLPLRTGGSEVEVEAGVERGVGEADREGAGETDREGAGEGLGVPSGERGP